MSPLHGFLSNIQDETIRDIFSKPSGQKVLSGYGTMFVLMIKIKILKKIFFLSKICLS